MSGATCTHPSCYTTVQNELFRRAHVGKKATQVGINLDTHTAFGIERKVWEKIKNRPPFDPYRAVRQLERLFPRAGVTRPSFVVWDP